MLKKYRISSYSRKFDKQFYEYYFRGLCERDGVTIDKFHDPLNNRKTQKTLSNNYLGLIFNSKQFKRDFIDYISGKEILDDYKNTIRRKLKHLLTKFDKLFDSQENSADGVFKIQEYFRKNKQCKLPWTQTEIVTAVNTFKFLVKGLE